MNQPSQPTPAGGLSPKPAAPKPASTASTPENGTQSPLSDQAKDLLSKDSLNDLINQLPPAVKDAGTKVAAGFNKLSTTEKVVGGALLLLGVRYLTRGGKSHKEKQADTLHELLLFVNDRVEGYKKASTESQDAQMRGYYQQLTSQSRQFANELNGHLNRLGDERETGTTLKGKLYRRLMEATATVTGHDEKAILATNVHGEQWAVAAYEDALEQNTLQGALRQAVARQHDQSEKTLKELKRLVERQ